MAPELYRSVAWAYPNNVQELHSSRTQRGLVPAMDLQEMFGNESVVWGCNFAVNPGPLSGSPASFGLTGPCPMSCAVVHAMGPDLSETCGARPEQVTITGAPVPPPSLSIKRGAEGSVTFHFPNFLGRFNVEVILCVC